MTNREYENKLHRGSSPTSFTGTRPPISVDSQIPPERWKDQIWSPAAEPRTVTVRDAPPGTTIR